MSMSLFVLLAAGTAPGGDAWQDAMTETAARFEAALNVREHSGFLPVIVSGRRTGLYFSTESYSDLASMYPSLTNIKLDSPVVYSLGYGGDFHECAAAFISASVLVSKFGGKAFEPQGGVFMSAQELQAAAAECLKQAE